MKFRNNIHIILTLSGICVVTLLHLGCRTSGDDGAPRKEVATSVVPSQTPPPIAKRVSNTQFAEAALNGQMPIIEQGIEEGINLNEASEDGRTPLMLASFNGHQDVVSLLLSHNAKVDFRDTAGRTALMYASSGPFQKTVKLLIDAGANVNAQDGVEKWTPLMFAAGEGLLPVVEVLLLAGAESSIRDIDGDTALDFAKKKGHQAVVARLSSK